MEIHTTFTMINHMGTWYVGLCPEDSKPMLGRPLSRKASQADAELTHVKLETQDTATKRGQN
eukprot:7701047-Heterocapsa_arctica.AAC.1